MSRTAPRSAAVAGRTRIAPIPYPRTRSRLDRGIAWILSLTFERPTGYSQLLIVSSWLPTRAELLSRPSGDPLPLRETTVSARPTPPSRPPTRRRAFTLIELLVVIAIIAIL